MLLKRQILATEFVNQNFRAKLRLRFAEFQDISSLIFVVDFDEK